MEVGETLTLDEPQDFRDWLQEHHQSAKEIWLLFYKKASGRQRLSIAQDVEEALCFGWIDGTVKTIDQFAPQIEARAGSGENMIETGAALGGGWHRLRSLIA